MRLTLNQRALHDVFRVLSSSHHFDPSGWRGAQLFLRAKVSIPKAIADVVIYYNGQGQF